ncbi:MAG TPA: type II toxin-antitoxin system prevent-host-death family antitoxin [Longimicrobium sp.]|nr:type II toxin-antitoxin system prevent-host-death family antitoxin [Longimicrobium sp.]
MATKEINVAQGELTDALAAVEQGDEVVLVRAGQPVARLVPVEDQALAPLLGPRKAGSARGLFTVPDDFDAPLEDFRDYM